MSSAASIEPDQREKSADDYEAYDAFRDFPPRWPVEVTFLVGHDSKYDDKQSE